MASSIARTAHGSHASLCAAKSRAAKVAGCLRANKIVWFFHGRLTVKSGTADLIGPSCFLPLSRFIKDGKARQVRFASSA